MHLVKMTFWQNSKLQIAYKSDNSYLKTSRALDVLIHSGKPNSVG